MKKKRKLQIQQLMKEILITLIITCLLGIVLTQTVFKIEKNVGYGMREALDDGDLVYIDRLARYKRFSLVNIKTPRTNESSIRRIIGLPGERIYYINDALYVNDRLVVERFLESRLAQIRIEGNIYTENFDSKELSETTNGILPEGKYLVLGDNRPFTTDSRYYGLINEDEIIGTMKLRWWPLHKIRSYD
ncbi:signal peptidase I [Enterococcus sp. 9D6_DIV0238]|uniref:Signal peptidase I n=3 Tax=Enterococcus TaxID=1350 RepID=A0A200JD69_9ENTE|nr:signal peptidase I [Enterococcus sp. 9D6_DIV0238]